MIETLPPRLETVVVPKFFSPSQWERMEACALSVWSAADGSLPASLAAVVGTIFHDVRERVGETLPSVGDRASLVREYLRERVAAEEESLTRAGEGNLLPLETTYGRRKWLDLVLDLESWARRLGNEVIVCGRPKGSSKAQTTNAKDSFAFGSNPWWASTTLRLRGRPDQARRDGDIVDITDYKSGGAVAIDGNITATTETQLHLYMLMAEELGAKKVRGRIHARRGVFDVEWGTEQRTRMRERVFTMLERFPPDAEISAEDAARVGPHCIGCPLRPRCAKYLREVPTLWENGKGHPRPLPYDAWGTVVALANTVGSLTIKLRDPNERQISIEGLDSSLGPQLSATGPTYFFGLEPTEDVVMHGVLLHPRTFHERPPGPRWRRANRLRIYVAP